MKWNTGILDDMKSQNPSTKLQTNLKFQYQMTKTKNRFAISNFGHCDLPFDLAQGGESYRTIWDL